MKNIQLVAQNVYYLWLEKIIHLGIIKISMGGN